MYRASRKQEGFTIVELLIVVVVIAILAAITIVSYNGITANAQFSKEKSDLASINKAILLYYVDNGAYPNSTSACTNGWCGWDQVTGNSFVPNVSPKYLTTLPQLPTEYAPNNTFLYRSIDGTAYQLMRYLDTGLPSNQLNSPMAASPNFTGTGWGYKSGNITWGGAAI
jgi:prepilin-type N-terminal cleavage/methylation domain-containing protein